MRTHNRRIVRLTVAMLWLLLIQFLVGMGVNLFVSLPASRPGTRAANYFSGLIVGIGWAVAHGAPLLQLHIAIGAALFVVGVVLAASSLRGPALGVRTAAVVGWLGVMGAAFNGGGFLNYGHDFSSMLMAVTFALAALCYVAVLLALTRAAGPYPADKRQFDGR